MYNFESRANIYAQTHFLIFINYLITNISFNEKLNKNFIKEFLKSKKIVLT